MSEKLSMKFFMREELKQDEIIEIPGLETFKDEEGKVIPFRVRVLGVEEIRKIQKNYTKQKVVLDEKGKQIITRSGAPLVQKETDSETATNRIIVEALVYPDLKDPELMKFYGCLNVADMPMKLFKNPADYKQVSTSIIETLGLTEASEEPLTDDEVIEEAKN